MLKNLFKSVAVGTVAMTAFGLKAHAQSSDALIEKLVDKGILTLKEANDLRDETDKNFTTAFQTKTGMPDWVSGYKFYGDFRGRYEENNSENTEQYQTRDRYRYRLRFGVTISMLDNFEAGFRLASGNPQFNSGNILVGGQPITANQDLNSLDSRNFIWIDAAYGRWTPVNSGGWTFTTTIGKMDNPFQLSNMVWDNDINPAGGAFVLQRAINDQQSIKGIGAFYVLDEFNQGYPSGNTVPGASSGGPLAKTSHDPYVYGGQILWESSWTPKLDSSLGLAAFNIVDKDSLSSYVQPFYNAGNTRNQYGFLKNNYNPLIASASLTYKLDSFPMYNGLFPVKLAGEYMNNPGADRNNTAYRFGFTLGKAGNKRTWQVAYRYQRMEADAWYDALVDDDNGAFYAAQKGTFNPSIGAAGTPSGQMVNTGKATGWYGGTNVKGHLVQATYSFTDFLDLSVSFYLNSLILKTPNETSDSQHFMVDLAWRF